MSAPQKPKATAPQRKRGAWRHPYEMSRERPPVTFVRSPTTLVIHLIPLAKEPGR